MSQRLIHLRCDFVTSPAISIPKAAATHNCELIAQLFHSTQKCDLHLRRNDCSKDLLACCFRLALVSNALLEPLARKRLPTSAAAYRLRKVKNEFLELFRVTGCGPARLRNVFMVETLAQMRSTIPLKRSRLVCAALIYVLCNYKSNKLHSAS